MAKATTTTARRQGPTEADTSPELTALGEAFRRLSRAMRRLRGLDTRLEGAELSHAQFQLLIELDERGEMPAGELAAAAQLSPGTVTQMLDALAESGHVARVRLDTDRRVVVTRLTASGAQQIEAKRAAWQARWEDALAGLSKRELAAATAVLGRIGAMFEQGASEGDERAPRSPQDGPSERRKPR